MRSSAILLGAGASVDAGLPTADHLTKVIYEDLASRDRDAARVFGYVIAKLQTRNARNGASPYADLNVEEVYATLRRYLGKVLDPLSEFVVSWDEVSPGDHVNAQQLAPILERLYEINEGFSGPVIALNRDAMSKVDKVLASAQRVPPSGREVESRLRVYLEALVRRLEVPKGDFEYIDEFVKFCRGNSVPICTLNYDLLVENSCDSLGIPFDYGLSYWNDAKFIRFHGKGLKLIKLHGSIDWFENSDNINIYKEKFDYRTIGGAARGSRGLIFGAQSEKLVPNGPYLQLRSEFQSLLRECSALGIIGYSFADAHLNALIRAWVSTRKSSKLVVLNPAQPDLSLEKIGRWYRLEEGENLPNLSVDVVHVKAGAKQGLKTLLAELESPPSLERSDWSSLIRTIELH